ncbi:MAG: 2-C-methyl-D-erythritol 4-phosphate cytidylyltransferase [Candidatus Omnitrophica bacterium]|nr:2-C-methyl-D-erythritol 4-phosphate cytidylyltransferase [Candidatus Omnitrophota bacterium]
MKVAAIIPTAGTGERFGGAMPKPLADLHGKSVIARTLDVFERTAVVDRVILIAHADYADEYKAVVKAEGFKKVSAVVIGGATRSQSVRNGLRALDKDIDVVLVHDGVRPLVTSVMIEEGVALAVEMGAAVAAMPVKPTLKVVEPKTHVVRETLDRTLVWEIQTPQVFKREILDRAYADDSEATDDAALVERMGVAVRVFKGSYTNIKITTPDDLIVAEAFWRS